ncbi:MAG TPA: hypothetical protein VEC37_06975 [Bacillota bacterium]|nr:hypothetical protein [Bacillota bacterium]
MKQINLLKRILLLLACVVMGLTLAGCHSDDNKTVVPEESDFVTITVNGQTYTYKMGPTGKDTTLTGIPFGFSRIINYNIITNQNNTITQNNTTTFIYGSTSTINTYLTDALDYAEIRFSKTATGTYTYEGAIAWQNNNTKQNGDLIELKITQYDDINGRIKGTFSGVLSDEKEEIPVTGSFNVKRVSYEAIEKFLEPA